MDHEQEHPGRYGDTNPNAALSHLANSTFWTRTFIPLVVAALRGTVPQRSRSCTTFIATVPVQGNASPEKPEQAPGSGSTTLANDPRENRKRAREEKKVPSRAGH
jgi:hypothetical protein